MRIATLTVERETFGSPSANERRMNAAREGISRAAQLGVDLLVFPAGFFTAPSERHISRLARRLVEFGRKHGLCIVVGIDIADSRRKRDLDAATAKGCLPFFIGGSNIEPW